MQQTIFKPVSIPCTSFYLIILSGRIQKSIRGEAADGCSPGVLAWECRGTVGVGLCGEDWERDCHGGTGMDRGIFGEGGDSPWNWIKQKKDDHFTAIVFLLLYSIHMCHQVSANGTYCRPVLIVPATYTSIYLLQATAIAPGPIWHATLRDNFSVRIS